MDKIVKILLLEDNHYDAELIHHQLSKGKVKFQHLHVSEYEPFAKALDDFKPDLILSDYNLGVFTGLDALELVKEKYPLVPFIIVTGALNEETAADTIKRGAWDYVVKERLLRLDSAIINALKLKQEKEEIAIVKEKLELSNELQTSLLQTIPFGMHIVDEQGNILFLSKNHQQLFGDSAIGKKCWSLYRDTKLQCTGCPLISGIKLGETTAHETDGILGGKSFEIIHTGMMFKGQKAILEVFQDITARKRTEQIQRVLYNISNAANITDNLIDLATQIQIELGTILDTSNFYIALYDEKTDVFMIPYMVDKFDDIKSFPGGKSLTTHVLKTQKSLLAKKARQRELIKTGDIELIGTTSEVWLGVPLKIAGKSIGVIAVQSYTNEDAFNESDKEMLEFVSEQTSISIERIRSDQQLKKALEKATQSDRLKSAFLANMSHEIRTPMNGILGFSNLLQKHDLSGDKQQTYITMIKQSGHRMLNIINDIINISKIESGQIEFHLVDLYLNEQIEYIYSFFEVEAKAKGLQISYNNALALKDSIITTDREKLLAILTNLVKNSIKFCDKGSIEFGYTEKDQYIEFYVKDTGIGINKNRQDAIFERFIQADIVDKDARQGFGLGLSISKAYIKGLGGNIWVESEKGEGSIFYFTIPRKSNVQKIEKTTTKKFNEALDSQGKAGKLELKVLVVEDDETSDMIISLMLKESSREILHATNGIEAIDLCTKNPDIELILMDIKMPGIDGYETTRRIRRFNKDVIIIGQSAYALDGDKEKAIDEGFNNYLPKPIEQDKLDSFIQQYFINQSK